MRRVTPRPAAAALLLVLLLGACGAAPAAPQIPQTPAAALPSVTPDIPTPVPTLAAPTGAPAQPSVPAATPTTEPSPQPAVQPRASRYGEEVLFLRNGTLVARSVVGGNERLLADAVIAFAADSVGRRIALLRETSISLIMRSGAAERLLIDRVNATDVSWTPDGLSLLFSRHPADAERPLDWPSWGVWCSAAEVVRYDLATNQATVLGAGCDPAAASDGRRIAYAGPPQTKSEGYNLPGERNRLVLVNRNGANGWVPAEAATSSDDGLLVYAPAFAPNGTELAYERFVGYRALVDINLTEVRNVNGEQVDLLIGGFGWGGPALFAPDGTRVALVENNWSDPRGVGGYEPWALNLVTLSGARQVMLPEGEVPARGDQFQFLSRVTAAAWAPDSSALVVQLPAQWQPGVDPYQPLFESFDAGALWLIAPDGTPLERLVDGADAVTSLAWLPADLQRLTDGRSTLNAPADWPVAGALAAESAGQRLELLVLPAGSAPDGEALKAVLRDVQLDAPFDLPDGSRLLSLRGTTAGGSVVAGAVRVLTRPDATLVAVVFAPAADWTTWRSVGIGLIGAVEPAPADD